MTMKIKWMFVHVSSELTARNQLSLIWHIAVATDRWSVSTVKTTVPTEVNGGTSLVVLMTVAVKLSSWKLRL